MDANITAGPEHLLFMQWAQKRGVYVNGVIPARFDGHRIGLAAARNIQAGEILVKVPTSAMVTLDTVPKSFRRQFEPGTPVNAILASFMVPDTWCQYASGQDEEKWNLEPWTNILPTPADLENDFPLLWPYHLKFAAKDQAMGSCHKTPGDSVSAISSPTTCPAWSPVTDSTQQVRDNVDDGENVINHNNHALSSNHPTPGESTFSILPPSISGVWNSMANNTHQVRDNVNETKHNTLARQEQLLNASWEAIRDNSDLTKNEKPIEYLTLMYYWLLVNTRVMYYDGFREEGDDSTTSSVDSEDQIALVPFADYFNHASDAGVEAQFDGKNYVFKTTREHDIGEETFVSYGCHSNDLLLAEYGFILDENSADGFLLDDIVFESLDNQKQRTLKEHNYYGNYTLSAAGVCYRTEVAAAICYMSPVQWPAFVQGYDDGGFSQARNDAIVASWVKRLLKEVEISLAGIDKLLMKGTWTAQDLSKLDVARRRWCQIGRMCREALKELDKSRGEVQSL